MPDKKLIWHASTMVTRQQTIKNPIWCCGNGLHSGENTRVQLCPAKENTGIVFHVMEHHDIKGIIPASISSIKSGQFRTVLQNGNHSVQTTEHLLAAISAFGISNLIIEVWGNEIPIHDGSANAWTLLIEMAGIVEQQEIVPKIRILRTIEVDDKNGWCKFIPYPHFEIEYHLNYTCQPIGVQHFKIVPNKKNFVEQIADAKTFGLLSDYHILLEKNLSNGSNLQNTLVFTETGLLNPHMSKWDNEPVRHKILDAIGDLSLIGKPVIGKFIGHQSGHCLNLRLAEKLINSSSNWMLEDC
jgi:UDP-3-O-[3-hydroxymyristoyl] N-acetylglucosamine deacetylase